MDRKNHKPRGRFAPSPSGLMHLGNAWTAFLAWLDIRKLGGTMVLRIEDLDPERSRKEYVAGLIDDLHWLGLDWDEGPDTGGPYAPYCQSERSVLYEDAFVLLQQKGLVYPCGCSRAELRNVASAPHPGDAEVPYSGRCKISSANEEQRTDRRGRRPAFRLSVDEAVVEFADLVFGIQHQELSKVCGDFVIRRTDGVFAYQLAVVVDDAHMDINRVLRGADLLTSTPRQIYLWNLLGYQPPEFLHVPLLLGSDGDRLSKRHGSLSIAAMRNSGVRSQAIIGQLAAWAGIIPKAETVHPKELIDVFEISRLPRVPIVVPETGTLY